MNLLIVDFETYFDQQFSLKHLSIPEYVADPRFLVHGIAIKEPGQSAVFRWDVDSALLELRQRWGNNLERITVVAHNAKFDLYILQCKYGLAPRYCMDSMMLANHVHGAQSGTGGEKADLATLAAKYDLPSKGSLDFAAGLRSFTPMQRVEMEMYACHDVELTSTLARMLVGKIDRPQVELPLMDHTIKLFASRSLAVDVPALRVLRGDMESEQTAMLKNAGIDPKQAASSTQFAVHLAKALAATGRCLPTKDGAHGPIPAVAKKDQSMQDLVDDHDPLVQALVRARLGQTATNTHLARIDRLIATAQAAGGLMPVDLVYYGAHTGRFAGRGINVQNLPKSGHAGRIRGCLTAHPGHQLIIADLAQIEARVLAVFAGQQEIVSAFRDGRDIYCEQASAYFGERVIAPAKDDTSSAAVRMRSLRTVGKQAVLGLGYGMGAVKFAATLQSDPLTAAMFGSGLLSALKCKQIVDAYRSGFVQIPRTWQAAEHLFRSVLYGGVKQGSGVTFQHMPAGSVAAGVLIRLPTGRCLRYPGARLETGPQTFRFIDKHGNQVEKTTRGSYLVYGKDVGIYGGLIVENIIQGIARDILVEAMLRIEARGIPVVFHVHDEVVAMVPDAQVDAACAMVTEEMCRQVPWMPELPLACEVKARFRYEK